jgi:hypothetical protein
MPKFSKNLGNSITFFPQNAAIFLGTFSKDCLDHVAANFFFSQTGEFSPPKKKLICQSQGFS